jgi:excisionase family DNA binding protein
MKEGIEKDLERPKETARRLGVSVPKVYALASSGELPSVRIGKSVRFRPADVDRFIRGNRRKGEAA